MSRCPFCGDPAPFQATHQATERCRTRMDALMVRMMFKALKSAVAADPEDAAVLAAGAVEKVEDLIRQRQAVDHLYKPFGNG